MEYPAGSVSINVIHHWDFWTWIGIFYDFQQPDPAKWIPWLIDWKEDYLNSN